METQTNGFIWTLLTRQITKKHCNKKLKNNIIKNKIERANTELNRESDSTKPQSQTRMFSRRKKTFLSFTLSLFYLFVAPVMQVLPVYASAPAAAYSVWEFMITELASANVIITDSAVNAAYASALSALPAATATAAEIDAAIATAAVNCGVDLSTVFANTAASAASVGIEASAATAGENLAATCANFFAGGETGAVIPALGQAALDAAGVTGIIAGIAYICKMFADDYGELIQYNAELDQIQQIANMNFAGLTMTGAGGLWTCTYNNKLYYGWGYVDGDHAAYLNFQNNNVLVKYSNGSTWVQHNSYGQIIRLPGGKWKGDRLPSNWESMLGQLGTVGLPLHYSPSFASNSGYQKYDPDYNAEQNPDATVPNYPELKPLEQYENGYGLSPISADDYNSLVNQINQLSKPNTNPEQESNDTAIGNIVNTIFDPYFVPIGDPVPSPDPQPTGTPDPNPTGTPDPNPTGTPDPNPQPTGTPDPQPTGSPNPNPKPDTHPYPDPETVPQPTPIVNPTPDSDIVPAPVPYPDPETPTEQDKTDTDTKITPIDLREKFPFCIPFDILKIMKLFQGGREAPCFTWEIPFGAAGSGSVTVDLSAWDSAAALLRTLELILFIMLLAVGTRNLIGGSS